MSLFIRKIYFVLLFALLMVTLGFTLAFTTNQSASLVIGQAAFNTANTGASTTQINGPVGVWVQGMGLITSEEVNNRYMLYNSIPSANLAAADLEIGQPDFVSSAVNNGGISGRTLNTPRIGMGYGHQLFLADKSNNRVLIFNNFPVTNFSAADVVLGQPDFVSNNPNQGLANPTARP